MKRALPLLALMGLFAWLFIRRRKAPTAAKGKTVVGADGRTYRLIAPSTTASDGTGSPSIWRGPDGKDYFPDLGWDVGNSTAPPMMRSFGA